MGIEKAAVKGSGIPLLRPYPYTNQKVRYYAILNFSIYSVLKH